MKTAAQVVILLLGASGCTGTGAVPGSGAFCETGQVTLVFQTLQVTDTCFVVPGADPTSTTNVISSGATETGSANGTGTIGMQLVFSDAASCVFEEGSTFDLSDPCLFIGQASGDPALPQGLYGYVNTCSFSGTSESESEACTAAGVAVDTSFTAGSITLNQWSDQVGGEIQVTFSGDASLTAINPIAGGGLSNYAVPVTGTLSALVPNQPGP